ncbi:hypothetical protein EDB81DRAFT_814545 [Dactylonectria macrodidyma]|uniref:HD domain-containing protein n=1 Tax=Dactylonectria macrodidyma TaxID=307937 RepID=A0A9P9IG40_9HYPO|nr:hypothetical protein EDB81DRAFT_814545 [Dactylonectria macrodidyma]
MASLNPASFPSFPISGICFPDSRIISAALDYAKQHTTSITVNHCLRSTAFALLLRKKLPQFAEVADELDTEMIVLSGILHDMGWATTKSLLSKDKRFEVDGANIARDFIIAHSKTEGGWDEGGRRLQMVWDAIALHGVASIAPYKESEVALVHFGIMADFFGPNFPGGAISVEEYKEVVAAFPRVGFTDALVQTMCGLCRDKPETTFDNDVKEFGLAFGFDGKGTGKEDFRRQLEGIHHAERFAGALAACDEIQ